MHDPATATHHVWQRWLPLWYGIFYVMLLFTTILSLGEASRSLGLSGTILGLSALLSIWYGFCIAPRSQYLQSHPLHSMGYLAIGWVLWFGLTLLDPLYLFLLFGLYPQVFFFRPMPWKIIDALMLTALSLWRQVLSLGGLDGSLLITLVATASGILTTLFIEAIIRQSRERHRLIRELEGTRYELAVAERQAGVTEERQRLAREIHDTLVQGFTSIVMHLEAAEGALPSDMRALQRHFDQARRTARENLAEARRLMWALQPEALDRASLPEVLTKLTRSWSEENRVTASATITGTSRSLRPEIEVTLLRAAQEALANAGKYAHASQVTLTLSYMEDVVVLDVQDDGRGFDTLQLLASTAGQTAGGFGLKALRERAEQLGGTLSIESTPGEGTTIAVALPAVSNESFLCPEAAKEVSL
jgi:signal transduction histidine kinase